MDQLPLLVDVPVAKKDVSLKGKVNEVEKEWARAESNTECRSAPLWEGVIDKPLSRGLKAVESFFVWYRESIPKRRDRTVSVLRGLDPSGRPLPSAIEALRIDEWDVLNRYFQGVAHHNETARVDEFDGYVEQLESFILDRLRPRTFEDHAALDEIIREVEGGDEA